MEQKIRTAIAQLNSIPDRPEWAMLDAGEIRIESKDSSVCIAIDDIGVKKQKDKRQKPEAEKQGNKDDPEWCHRTAAKLTDARLDRKAPGRSTLRPLTFILSLAAGITSLQLRRGLSMLSCC